MFFVKGPKGLFNFKVGVGLSFDFIASVPDPLLNYKNLLSDLHDNSKAVKYIHKNKYAS